MADAEKSLLFVIKANIEDFNKKLGDTEKGFNRSFGNIRTTILSVGKAFTVAAAGMVAALSVIAVKSIDTADQLVDIANACDLTTDEVQKLNYALRFEGINVDVLTSVMKFYSKAMETAATSQAKATEEGIAFNDAFTRLGINLKTFKTLTTAEQIDTLFRAISNIPDANDRATLTTAIFGKGAMDLLPVIQDWVKNQERLNKLLKDFGIPEDELKKMGDMKADMETFKIALEYIGLKITETLMPALKAILPYLPELAKKFADLVTPENIGNVEELAKDFLKIADAVVWIIEKILELNKTIRNIVNPDWAPLIPNLLSGKTKMGIKDNQWQPITTPEIPAAQFGGVFMRPQLAMVGEAGPEAIVPLGSLGSMGIGGGTTELHVHIGNYIGDDTTRRQLVRDLQGVLNEETRRSRFAPSKTEKYGGNNL
jgi:hypothetical protein